MISKQIVACSCHSCRSSSRWRPVRSCHFKLSTLMESNLGVKTIGKPHQRRETRQTPTRLAFSSFRLHSSPTRTQKNLLHGRTFAISARSLRLDHRRKRTEPLLTSTHSARMPSSRSPGTSEPPITYGNASNCKEVVQNASNNFSSS